METNDFLRQRSITACMRSSYDLMTGHCKQVVRHTWATNLPYAILLATTLYFTIPNAALHDWGEANPLLSFVVQTLVYLGTIVMTLVSIHRAFRLFKPKEKSSGAEKAKKGAKALAILRHLGGYIMTCFLGGLIFGVLACLVFLPAGIIGTAQTFSQLGALDGDPLGVPAYFTPLLLVVLVASSFIFVYLMYWLCISLAYQYGSYTTIDKEKEALRQEMKKPILA